MSKATTLTAVSYFSGGTVDTVTTTPDIYDDVVRDMGAMPYLTNSTTIAIPANSLLGITLPNTIIDVYGVSYASRWLGELTLREVEWINPVWRSTTGTPRSYITQDETRDLFLFPSPNNNVPGSIVVYHTEYRSTIPFYLEPAVAMHVLAIEMTQPTEHQDTDLAAVAQQIGDLIMSAYA